jgi:hypothetical protein
MDMEPISMPVLVYGEIMEYCKAITITMINRFEASELMTIHMAMPGYTVGEAVVTLPEPLITGPLTATKTTIIPGETYTMTHGEAGADDRDDDKQSRHDRDKNNHDPGEHSDEDNNCGVHGERDADSKDRDGRHDAANYAAEHDDVGNKSGNNGNHNFRDNTIHAHHNHRSSHSNSNRGNHHSDPAR